MNENGLEVRLNEIKKYTEQIIPVFPIFCLNEDGSCMCGKNNCSKAGKHPITKNGFYDATTDIKQIKKWLKMNPKCGWAFPTGDISGVFVVDTDVKHNGIENWKNLIEGRKNPRTTTVETLHLGIHHWYKMPLGADIGLSVSKIGKGVDIRGNGGYAIGPPTYGYSFIDNEIIAEAPQWLIEKLIDEPKHIRTNQPPIDNIKNGERNQTLTSVAGSLRHRGASEEIIVETLKVINKKSCIPPLQEDEVLRIASSIVRYEPQFSIKTGLRSGYDLTDIGNAERFTSKYKDILRFVPKWGKWLIWDGKRWKIDASNKISQFARKSVKSIYGEAENAMENERGKAIAKWAMTSQSDFRLKAMIRQASSFHEEGIPIEIDNLNTNPWLLNCNNGTLDLKTGQLHEFVPDEHITKIVDVDYISGAKSETWDRFLRDIMGDNEQLIRFLQKAVGYSLTGCVTEQCLFILHGVGSNGKSTFLEAILNVIGSEYAVNTPTETIMMKSGATIPNDIARLSGVRFVTINEVDEGRRMSESLVKQLTGGDTMTARFLHQEFFDFKPQFKLFIRANHKPIIQGTDHAIWRRIKLIPFRITISDAQCDPHLLSKLLENKEAILSWAVEGCNIWQKEGFDAPGAVKQATSEYREEMDVIGSFLESTIVEVPGKEIQAKLFYEKYKIWCEVNGEHPISGTAFGLKMVERDVKKDRTSEGNFYQDIAFLDH